MTGFIIDTIGWIGSAMVVMAYALNMYGKLTSTSAAYYGLNIGGSACLIINTFYHNAIPSAVVNIVWILLAFLALVRNPRKG